MVGWVDFGLNKLVVAGYMSEVLPVLGIDRLEEVVVDCRVADKVVVDMPVDHMEDVVGLRMAVDHMEVVVVVDKR